MLRCFLKKYSVFLKIRISSHFFTCEISSLVTYRLSKRELLPSPGSCLHQRAWPDIARLQPGEIFCSNALATGWSFLFPSALVSSLSSLSLPVGLLCPCKGGSLLHSLHFPGRWKDIPRLPRRFPLSLDYGALHSGNKMIQVVSYLADFCLFFTGISF